MPEIIGIVKVDFTDLEDNRHVYMKGMSTLAKVMILQMNV